MEETNKESKNVVDFTEGPSVPLPFDKITSPSIHDNKVTQVALVAAGSFNPPTFMHLHMFELGKEALLSRGFHVVGGYMSPVNDAYGKPCLVSAEHRIRMCQLAVEESPFIMVDSWESLQPSYQRTLTVLARVANKLHFVEVNGGPLQVMLLCGADLLESFSIKGVWLPDQIEKILGDHGIICIQRGHANLRKMVLESDIMAKYEENIIVIDGFESDVSSTAVREKLARGESVEHLTPPKVIEYINRKGLFKETPICSKDQNSS